MKDVRICSMLIVVLFEVWALPVGCGVGGKGGSVPTSSISGAVSDAVVAGVMITLAGAVTASTTTDASGNYSFSGLAKGNYT